MARRPSKTAHLLPTVAAEAVLAGDLDVDARELFDLIHHVNPTGRDLGRQERDARYRLKSRLQSLLVRRHPDLLAVEAQPGEDDVVGLAHREGLADACHAVVAELDEDARSWVRWQLDTLGAGEDSAFAPRPVGSRSTAALAPSDAVARAEAAMADYDYETAKELLTEAFAAEHGALRVARALLELLVDTYADDAAALALAAQLPPDTARNPSIRLLLALASARTGEAAAARQWLDGCASPRRAEVWALVIERILQGGDLDTATRWLAEAQAACGAVPELVHCAAAVAARQAAQWAPREQAMDAAWQRGDRPAAEAMARALLDDGADSAPARRILREVERERLAAAVGQQLALADRHLDQGEGSKALAVLRAVQAQAPDAPGLAERLVTAEAALRTAQRRQARQTVATAWTRGEAEAALTGWLGLEADDRAQVGPMLGDVDLGLLERLAARGPARAAVQAWLALRQVPALAGQDPEAALALLEAHPLLRGVRAAQDLRSTCEQALAAAAETEALAKLEEATAALAEGRLEEAAAALAAMPTRRLPDALAARQAALTTALWREERLAELRRRHDRLVAADDHLAARALADELADKSTDADQRDQWRAVVARHRSTLRSRWPARGEAVTGPVRAIQDSIGVSVELAWTWDPDGRLIVARQVGNYLFLQWTDPDVGQVRRQACLRLGQLRHVGALEASADRLTVVTKTGECLDFSTATLELLDRRVLLDGATDLWVTVPIPGGPIWLGQYDHDRASEWDHLTRVVERRGVPGQPHRSQILRDFRSNCEPWPLVGDPLGRVAVGDTMFRDLRFLDASGRPATAPRLPAEVEFGQLAVSPEDPAQIVALVGAPDVILEESPLYLWAGGPDRAERVALVADLDDKRSWSDRRTALATARGSGLVFVLSSGVWRTMELLAFRVGDGQGGRKTVLGKRSLTWREGGWTLVYRVPVAWESSLVADAASQRVWLLSSLGDELAIEHLGPEPPRCRLQAPRPRPTWWRLAPEWLPDPAVDATVKRLTHQWLSHTGEAFDAAVAREWQAAADPLQRRGVLRALLHSAKGERAVALASGLPLAERQSPGVLLDLAQQNRHGREVKMGSMLDVDTRDWPPAAVAHRRHLLGYEAVGEGRFAQALDLLGDHTAEERPECDCPVAQWRRVAHAALQPGWPGDDVPAELAELAAVPKADAALLAGRLLDVVAALDHPDVLRFGDAQALARLADAYLQLPPAEVDWFRAAAAMAALLGRRAADAVARPFALAEAKWPQERLDDVKKRARTWLAEALTAG